MERRWSRRCEPEAWATGLKGWLIEGEITLGANAVPAEGPLGRPHRLYRLAVTGPVGESDAAAAVAAEIEPLGAHLQPPVLTELLDRERAGLPIALIQLAFHGHAQSTLRLGVAAQQLRREQQGRDPEQTAGEHRPAVRWLSPT